jgi:hypothetical protein
MSKYLEYMKLLPKGLANIDKVFEGIVNETKLKYKTLSEDQQEEIIKRRVICQACPLNSINALESKEYKDLFGVNYKTDREDEHCSICSCNSILKTSSLGSDCGLSYYNETHPDNIQELKFTKYNKQ